MLFILIFNLIIQINICNIKFIFLKLKKKKRKNRIIPVIVSVRVRDSEEVVSLGSNVWNFRSPNESCIHLLYCKIRKRKIYLLDF